MDFSFSGVKPAAERGFTSPGTIAVFEIEDIKLEKNDSDKEFFNVNFGRAEDTFRERFFLTEKAASRFVYLYEKIMGTDQLPDDDSVICSNLKGKKIALKVSGQVSDQDGKGYAGLPYTAYARPEALIGELTWTEAEKSKNQVVIDAINNVNSNANGAAAPADVPGNKDNADQF